MVGWHHRLNGHEFEQTPGDSEGQGSLVCCSPWGYKESDMTQQLKNNKLDFKIKYSNLKIIIMYTCGGFILMFGKTNTIM